MGVLYLLLVLGCIRLLLPLVLRFCLPILRLDLLGLLVLSLLRLVCCLRQSRIHLVDLLFPFLLIRLVLGHLLGLLCLGILQSLVRLLDELVECVLLFVALDRQLLILLGLRRPFVLLL